MTKGKLTGAVLAIGVATTLAACGGGSTNVADKHTPTVSATTSTTTAVSAPTSTTVPVTVPGSSSTASSPLNAQALDQLSDSLGSLNASLSTANNDLNSPQGDS